MKTLQITMPPAMVRTLDSLVRSRRTNRSAYIRELIQQDSRRQHIRELERIHADGYRAQPDEPIDGKAWPAEAGWTDDWDDWERIWKEWNAAKSVGADSRRPTKQGRSSSSRATRQSRISTNSRSQK